MLLLLLLIMIEMGLSPTFLLQNTYFSGKRNSNNTTTKKKEQINVFGDSRPTPYRAEHHTPMGRVLRSYALEPFRGVVRL
jgi:hypothetical protein